MKANFVSGKAFSLIANSLIRRFSFFLLLILLSPSWTQAQVPQGFTYQAVAFTSSGEPIRSTLLPVRISIESDSLGGTLFWRELHPTVTTNGSGLFSLVLGKGVRQAGDAITFSDIDWSVTPKFIRTEIDYGGWKTMGASRLWSVPFAMTAGDISGSLPKLAVFGTTSLLDEALFEVKNKNGQTVFAVYNEGVRVNVGNGENKAVKGGFAIGSFDASKADPEDLFVVSRDSVRVYLVNTIGKAVKGGFAIGSFDASKAPVQEYLRVTNDSVRIYINDQSKAVKGGFGIGSFDASKAGGKSYFDVNTSSIGSVDPSENRILWYPLKNAFLTGKVIVEKPDSVGVNSFASGYESKAKGQYSQALGYQAIARGDNSTSIGFQAVAHKNNSFAFGQYAKAMNEESYAFGRGAIAEGFRSYAFGSAGVDSSGTTTGVTYARGDYSFAFGQGALSEGLGSFAIGMGDTARGQFSTAMGYLTKASGNYSTAMGLSSVANGAASFSIGRETVSQGDFSFSAGSYSVAGSAYSIAMGHNANSVGFSSTAIGYNASSSNDYSISVGRGTISSGASSLALGDYARAEGNGSISLGQSIAGGMASAAIGQLSTASGNYSFSVGYNSVSGNDFCIAIGAESKAMGSASTAIGPGVQTSGTNATALGSVTQANGNFSTAIGRETKAEGDFSMALGASTIASSGYEFAAGLYNTLYSPLSISSWNSDDRLFVLGNGTSNSDRSNAITILKSGRIGLQSVTTPAYALELPNNASEGIGQARAYAWTTYSDGRLKSDQRKLEYGLNEILLLDPLEYFQHNSGLKNGELIIEEEGERNIGLIAQDVFVVIPEIVNRPKNEKTEQWSMSYEKLVPVLINAIKEQQETIEKQNIKIDKQEAEFEMLKAEVEALKAIILNTSR